MSENTWLINGYCHLANKTFFFIGKYFEGVVPAGRTDEKICERTKEIYRLLEQDMETGAIEEAVKLLEEYLSFATEYFEQGNPWKTREKDRRTCRNTILNTVQMIANLTVWMKALSAADQWSFCPAAKVEQWLSLDGKWQIHSVHSGVELPQTEELVINPAKSSFQMA